MQCAVVQRMKLSLQSIDFEVGRWCMGTFIVPYKRRPAIKLYKLHNNPVCFLFKALCGWWKAKLQGSLGCQIMKKKFSQFSPLSDEFLCYHTRPNVIMVVSDDQTTAGSLLNGIWIESIFRLCLIHSMQHQMDFYWKHHCHCLMEYLYRGGGGGGKRYFPYILLNEIQKMFSQPANFETKPRRADTHVPATNQVQDFSRSKRRGQWTAVLNCRDNWWVSAKAQ